MSEVMGFGQLFEATQELCGRRRGTEHKFSEPSVYPPDTESLCFQLLGKSDFAEADRDRLEQFCCRVPIHVLGLGCFKSNPPSSSDYTAGHGWL